MRLPSVSLIVCLWMLAAHASALTQPQAEAVARKYLATLPADGATHEATKILMADLDGNGTLEIVLWSTLLGPTYASSQLTVLADQGKGYVPAGSGDLWGNVEDMAVNKAVVEIKSKMPAPGDPRCCPSLQKTYRYTWKNAKLTEAE